MLLNSARPGFFAVWWEAGMRRPGVIAVFTGLLVPILIIRRLVGDTHAERIIAACTRDNSGFNCPVEYIIAFLIRSFSTNETVPLPVAVRAMSSDRLSFLEHGKSLRSNLSQRESMAPFNSHGNSHQVAVAVSFDMPLPSCRQAYLAEAQTGVSGGRYECISSPQPQIPGFLPSA